MGDLAYSRIVSDDFIPDIGILISIKNKNFVVSKHNQASSTIIDTARLSILSSDEETYTAFSELLSSAFVRRSLAISRLLTSAKARPSRRVPLYITTSAWEKLDLICVINRVFF